MQDFKKLKVWQESRELVKEIYKITEKFPMNEQYGITSQMRRAVTSISANIAEGCGKATQKEFRRFLVIANGSNKEVENFLIISNDLGYVNGVQLGEISQRYEKIGKMLTSLIKKLR
ncbi:MAG: four helix bundle protein [Candidatus Diapherotrites archaeon]|jgi:four helix bundle protein|uniref:Four helix bundle protein n=1 Tax=Candidatus Iainarchaeum sp. TaxID=3101447 RepID=A0A8T5GEP5_9ARCH|nr:four helix bundle protein [Candidatus Diapherotrites archaeon]MBT7241545.1 four helix bundle protein [Candidatus Diapherotrites archaeon]